MNLFTTNTITMHLLQQPLHRLSRSHRPRKNKTKYNGQILFSKSYNLDKSIDRRLHTMPSKQSVCEYKNKK